MADRFNRIEVRLASRKRPVAIFSGDRDQLIRRIRHLESAASLIAKFDAAAASKPIELTDAEKGLLVVAVKAWMLDTGRDRVPIPVLRLRDGMLDDLRGTPPPPPEVEVDVDRAGEVPEESEPSSPADAEARSRLLSVVDVLEHELAALHDLDDARLDAALTAMDRARSEIVATVAALAPPPANSRQ